MTVGLLKELWQRRDPGVCRQPFPSFLRGLQWMWVSLHGRRTPKPRIGREVRGPVQPKQCHELSIPLSAPHTGRTSSWYELTGKKVALTFAPALPLLSAGVTTFFEKPVLIVYMLQLQVFPAICAPAGQF